jgi:hypothetical protein
MVSGNGLLDTNGEISREGEWVCRGVWMNNVN